MTGQSVLYRIPASQESGASNPNAQRTINLAEIESIEYGTSGNNTCTVHMRSGNTLSFPRQVGQQIENAWQQWGEGAATHAGAAH